MAGCSEVDRSVNALPSGGKGGGEPCSGPSGTALTVPECAICLQTCVHPVRLPCRHVFCFLCAKGASWQSKRCALCRQELPEDFLERPALLSPEELRGAGRGHGEHAWYYEGRNGWWQYDERTSRELEDAFARGKKSTEMLIAGFLYVADLENMVQYRRNEHGRRRRMKRDVADIPKKGVAGLRLEADAGGPRESSADGADTASPGLTPAQIRPPAPSTSLESSFAQLQISQQSEQGQVRDREEEEEEEEEEEGLEPTSPPSRESSAQNTSVDESLSGSNSEGEDDEEEEEGPEEGTRTRQRLVEQVLPREIQMDRAPPGGESSSSSSRRPDGQCTVTEV